MTVGCETRTSAIDTYQQHMMKALVNPLERMMLIQLYVTARHDSDHLTTAQNMIRYWGQQCPNPLAIHAQLHNILYITAKPVVKWDVVLVTSLLQPQTFHTQPHGRWDSWRHGVWYESHHCSSIWPSTLNHTGGDVVRLMMTWGVAPVTSLL